MKIAHTKYIFKPSQKIGSQIMPQLLDRAVRSENAPQIDYLLMMISDLKAELIIQNQDCVEVF